MLCSSGAIRLMLYTLSDGYPPVSQKLFAETTAGALELTTRSVMAPLKHDRAGDTTVEELERYAECHAQRASAGLIITEGGQISADAKGYIHPPPAFTPPRRLPHGARSLMRCMPRAAKS